MSFNFKTLSPSHLKFYDIFQIDLISSPLPQLLVSRVIRWVFGALSGLRAPSFHNWQCNLSFQPSEILILLAFQPLYTYSLFTSCSSSFHKSYATVILDDSFSPRTCLMLPFLSLCSLCCLFQHSISCLNFLSVFIHASSPNSNAIVFIKCSLILPAKINLSCLWL